MIDRLLSGLLRRFDPETGHRAAIALLSATPPALLGLLARDAAAPELAIDVAGIRFAGPVCLAAGFDKDGRVPRQMIACGFHGVEAGTLTPLPQAGNPRPRLFRLVEDRAVINRMGFNNAGQDAGFARLAAARKAGFAGPVGINIGANKDSADRIADYARGAARMAPLADWLTVNISSPNTPGLRALQDAGALAALLGAVNEALPAGGPPVFLKVAPDLEPADIDAIARAAIDHRLGALIVANTTVGRPPLRSVHAGESGGLSGAPLAPLALQRLRDFRSVTGGALPLVSAGGIGDADSAWQRIRAGASLVQLYSALVYDGPFLARRIARGLVRHMRGQGYERLADAVGSG